MEHDLSDNLQKGTLISDPVLVKLYVQKFYEHLYKNEICNFNKQYAFLSNIQKKITETENIFLVKIITEKELFEIISKMSINKAPGIDGIPIEFYVEFWDIIKNEMCKIFNCIVSNLKLEGNQNLGIITLLSKHMEEDDKLNSWRPIPLLCVDTKILAKLYAERLKMVINNIIHPNQFCAPDKTIIDCNNDIRDVVYFCNTENLSGCLINLDWSKAFDRVDIAFLCKIMLKMGFQKTFIDIIMIFYIDRISRCLVNGDLTNVFRVERGVRQGCPLSMLLFIISQEPLYASIENSIKILPFKTPNTNMKINGYADDTNLVLADDQSIIEAFRLIKDFADASGAKLNVNKTKIFGMGR